MVMVNFYAAARSAIGNDQLQVEASTLQELILILNNQNDLMRKILPCCSYLLNSQVCHEKTQILMEADQIDVLPKFAGG